MGQEAGRASLKRGAEEADRFRAVLLFCREQAQPFGGQRACGADLLSPGKVGGGIVEPALAKQLIAETEAGFHRHNTSLRGCPRCGEAVFYDQLDGIELATFKIAAEVLFHSRERRPKSILECFLRRLALVEKDCQLSESGLMRAAITQHQVMSQQPGFGVEEPLVITIIVTGRVASHGE